MTLKQKKRVVYGVITILLVLAAVLMLWQSLWEKPKEGELSVTLSIDCTAVLGHEELLDPAVRDGGYLPATGVMLPEQAYHVAQGATVFGLLQTACAQENIQLEYNGSGALKTAYVEGIGYLYEFSCGEASGWIYRVNGEVANNGSAGRVLRNGDRVEWIYTLDLGRDAGYTGGLDDAA